MFYQNKRVYSLQGYVNADWDGNVNDRRSTIGYCFSFGSTIISLCSKKQSTVTLSCTEAEYVLVTLATQECIWLTRLFEDINEVSNFPTPIFCDNESAIKLVQNPVFHARMKLVATHHHFV